MKPYYLILAALFMSIFTYGQISNYEDVGVIVNDNSPVSMEIGNYFKQVRNIPEQNMIHIKTVTDEVIDTLEFRNIQYQVKSYMEQNDLAGKIKYLVTTKGVPFDIAVDSCHVGPPNHSFVYCSSVESELTLLFSEDSTKIIQSGSVLNPYFGDTTHHSESAHDILLVSRLDGNTLDDVLNLIDRSGPETFVDKQNGQFVFDISFLSDTVPTFWVFENMMLPAIDTLDKYGWNTVFHGEYELPSGLENVLGFVGCIWGAVPEGLDIQWYKGSFAEMIITLPEFTFYDSLNSLGYLQLGDLIGNGCTAASGYIHPYFSSQINDYRLFFSRYYKENIETKYNLAESYYMAATRLSWINILVGDPKTTITTVNSSSVENIDAIKNLQLFPNPANDIINLVYSSEVESQLTILVYDRIGKLHLHETRVTFEGRNVLEINVSDMEAGLYFVRIMDAYSAKASTKKLMVK